MGKLTKAALAASLLALAGTARGQGVVPAGSTVELPKYARAKSAVDLGTDTSVLDEAHSINMRRLISADSSEGRIALAHQNLRITSANELFDHLENASAAFARNLPAPNAQNKGPLVKAAQREYARTLALIARSVSKNANLPLSQRVFLLAHVYDHTLHDAALSVEKSDARIYHELDRQDSGMHDVARALHFIHEEFKSNLGSKGKEKLNGEQKARALTNFAKHARFRYDKHHERVSEYVSRRGGGIVLLPAPDRTINEGNLSAALGEVRNAPSRDRSWLLLHLQRQAENADIAMRIHRELRAARSVNPLLHWASLNSLPEDEKRTVTEQRPAFEARPKRRLEPQILGKTREESGNLNRRQRR